MLRNGGNLSPKSPYAGDWLFSFNDKKQIVETEITKKTTESSNFHEYYSYNYKKQLTELSYGLSASDPSFKLKYYYDILGNLQAFDFYYKNSSSAAMQAARAVSFSNAINQRSFNCTSGFLNKLAQELKSKEGAQLKTTATVDNLMLVFKATILSDNLINPYSQQDNLLFFPANRGDLYFNDFFLNLMKSNPLQVKCIFSDDLGGSIITQDFSYTYNKQKYPVTITEVEKDPDSWQYGNYTKTAKIEYVKND